MRDILKTHIESVSMLLVRLNLSYGYVKALNRLSDKEAFVMRKYIILEHSRVNFWILTVLDLCILLDQKGDYSLFKLFNFMESNKNQLNMTEVTPDDLHTWRSKFNDANTAQTISKLFHLRDKHYAHLDKGRKEYNAIAPTFDELDAVISLIEKIIFQLHNRIYHGHYQTQIYSPDKTDYLLQDLLKLDQLYEELENE